MTKVIVKILSGINNAVLEVIVVEEATMNEITLAKSISAQIGQNFDTSEDRK